jgi:CRP-like cAMP-binding protein
MKNNKLDALSQYRLTKPVDDIERLIDALMADATTITFRHGQRLDLITQQEPKCYLLRTGSVNVNRIRDGLVIGTVYGPAILGMSNFSSSLDPTYITADVDVGIGVVPLGDIFDILDKQQLWKSFSITLLYIVGHYHHYNLKMIAPTSYDKVRYQLIDLASKEMDFRASTNVTEFIHERTLLSRSHILSILSELKKGGYITIRKGNLLEINELPLRF